MQVYGHLLDQFWSPLTNDLTGPYGADTLENRLRFPLDVLNAIRKRVGDEFIVGMRYTADEAQKGGITAQEGLEISKKLAATGKVDFISMMIYDMTDVAVGKKQLEALQVMISEAQESKRSL